MNSFQSLLLCSLALVVFSSCEDEGLPMCTITSIENGEQIPHGQEVLIRAEASDEDGRITLVEFYIDGEKFERNNTVPYEIEWKTLEEQTGIHTIQVIATDDSENSVSQEVSITLTEGIPMAGFAAYPPSVNLGSSAQFYNESLNKPDNWLWDFGDGTTSEEKDPVHTYSEVGDYTVTLTVSNNYGTDTKTDAGYFTVTTPLTDYDGNTYRTVKIGNQLWMQENLKVTHYADGTPLVDGTGAGNIAGDYTTPYYFAYGDDESNVGTYGRLYTWAAVMGEEESSDKNPSEVQGACPAGWHVPSDEEWKEMEMYLGMGVWDVNKTYWRGDMVGLKLKESTTEHWRFDFGSLYPAEGTNESGFTALPAGMNKYELNVSGLFKGLSGEARFWSATESLSQYAWSRRLKFNEASVYRYDDYKYGAYSARCIRD